MTFRPMPKPEPAVKNKRKRIAFRSKKRASQEREYSKLRNQFLIDNPKCAVCNSPATEVHHKLGRIGDLLTDTIHFLAVDHDCHVKVENNPVWAKENGYSGDRI